MKEIDIKFQYKEDFQLEGYRYIPYLPLKYINLYRSDKNFYQPDEEVKKLLVLPAVEKLNITDLEVFVEITSSENFHNGMMSVFVEEKIYYIVDHQKKIVLVSLLEICQTSK